MTSSARPNLSLYELRQEGWKALTDRLGISGAMRFLMQYDPGHGNYTEDRRAQFDDLRLDEVVAEMNRPPK